MVFEAPQKDQQAWLISRLGADVSLGNVPPGDVLALEALRRGLRGDTIHLLTSPRPRAAERLEEPADADLCPPPLPGGRVHRS